MAKDKTKPRPDLTARREAERQAALAAARKRRKKRAINWLVGILIVGLALSGIGYVVWHVRDEQRKLSVSGPASVEQIKPPNAASDGLSIVANPAVTSTDVAPVVDLYLDYQSSSTVMAMQYYGPTILALADAGQMLLRYHFLTGSDAAYGNTAATRATIAATCADTVGKFTEYAQAIFTAAPYSFSKGAVTYTDDQLQTTFPNAAGIKGDDLTKFRACYDGRATSAFVIAMNTKNLTTPVPGSSAFPTGVTTTPTVLSNFQNVDLMTALQNEPALTPDPVAVLKLFTDAAGITSGG